MDRIPFNPYDFFGYLASGLLVVVGMQLTMGFPQVIGREFKLVDGLLLLLGVYVAGQMMATPAKALLEDGIVERILRRPSTNLFRDKKPFIRGLLFPGFYKAFPDHTRMRILEKVKTEGVHCSGEDLFLHVRFSPSVRNDEKLISRLNGFLNQYGFNRNLSFSCLLIGTAFL